MTLKTRVAVVAAAMLMATAGGASGAPEPASVSQQARATQGTTAFVPSPSHQAPCPEGLSRSTTTYAQSFNAIPEPRFNSGFFRFADGTEGSYSAKSYMSGGQRPEFMFLPYVQVPAGARTMMGFTTRGSSNARAQVAVNSVRAPFATSSAWSGVSVDITAATRDEGGWLGGWFEHRGSSAASTMYVDRAEIYRCRTNRTTRTAGSDRYSTAARVSQSFRAPASTVYIATGVDFPDALSAAAVAGNAINPILLTRPGSLPSATTQALQRLTPARIVVLGGPNAVSAGVLQQLRTYAPTVTRLGGDNRYGTSALISASFRPGVATVFVATGETFPDALSGGALAASRGGPLLLVRKSQIPGSIRTELSRLRPGKIVVLGGSGAVSDSVVNGLGAYVGGRQNVRRIAGTDRYEVSARVAAEYAGPNRTYLATGTDYADAVTGAALAGAQDAPLLLTRPLGLPGAVETRLDQIGESTGVVLGGLGSVDPIVRDQYGRTMP